MASYKKRENGKWSVRFREMDPDGKIINKRLSGFDTKPEAVLAYEDYKNGYQYIAPVAPTVHTVAELTDAYLNHAKTRIKESSFYTIVGKINKHIIPVLGNYPVKALTPAVILHWQQLNSEYSYKYQVGLRQQLGSILIFGQRYYDLPNPLIKTEPLRRLDRPKEQNIWTPVEFEKFLSVVDDPVYRCLYRFLFVSGCRKGEALALYFDDIDVDKNTVSICKSLTRKTKGSPWAVTTTKNTCSDRIVPIPHELVEEMLSLCTSVDNRFVFGGDAPLAENTLRRYHLKWCSAAGVHKIRIHDIRHSCASYLISSGVNPVAVARRLGHADVKMTLNTYSHVLPSDEDEVIKLMSKI